MLMSLPARCDVDREDRHQPGADVRAEQEERDVAEVEQAGEPDHDVESECEQCVDRAQHHGEDREEASRVLGEPKVREHDGEQ